jgi:hypothetical protein
VFAPGALILGFAIFGEVVLRYLHVSLGSLSIAGGLLLMLVALEMLRGSDFPGGDPDASEDIARPRGFLCGRCIDRCRARDASHEPSDPRVPHSRLRSPAERDPGAARGRRRAQLDVGSPLKSTRRTCHDDAAVPPAARESG